MTAPSKTSTFETISRRCLPETPPKVGILFGAFMKKSKKTSRDSSPAPRPERGSGKPWVSSGRSQESFGRVWGALGQPSGAQYIYVYIYIYIYKLPQGPGPNVKKVKIQNRFAPYKNSHEAPGMRGSIRLGESVCRIFFSDCQLARGAKISKKREKNVSKPQKLPIHRPSGRYVMFVNV